MTGPVPSAVGERDDVRHPRGKSGSARSRCLRDVLGDAWDRVIPATAMALELPSPG
jgi:hypothetical protein